MVEAESLGEQMGEFWFEVQTPTEVVAGDGTTPIGTLDPGRRYRAVARDDLWVTVPGPNDTFGYAPIAGITVLPDTSTEPVDPPEAPVAQPGGGTPASQPTTTSRLAIASMVLGILWLAFIGSVAAVVLGHLSLRQIDRSEGRQDGRAFAVTGLALGYIGVAVFVVLAVFVVIDERGEPSVAPLRPDRLLSLTGTTPQLVIFLELADGSAVPFEGTAETTLTFNTSGGPANGSSVVSLFGEDDSGNSYTVTYTAAITGTYDPDGTFEGSEVTISEVSPGFEALLPTETGWIGSITFGSDQCRAAGTECAFGTTNPNSLLLWTLPIPIDAFTDGWLPLIK